MNPGDIPPIGILLCAEKDDAVVQYTLPEDNQQIYAAKYMPYLPSKEELKRELNLDDFEKKWKENATRCVANWWDGEMLRTA